MSHFQDSQNVSPIDWDTLRAAAAAASQQSYSPYSHFPVGAALLTIEGSVFTGTNVENASFGLTICAERSATCSAVTAGAKQLLAVAIYTPTANCTPPCGACRQFLLEFASPALQVRSFCDTDHVLEISVDELLPFAFRL